MTEHAPPAALSAILARYAAAWQAHDLDAIVALHTPDTRFHSHGRGGEVRGREALRTEFARVLEIYPGFAVEEHRTLWGPAHWVMDWTLTFRRPGEDQRGIGCLDLVEVSADGLIARKDTYFDFAQFKAAFRVAA